MRWSKGEKVRLMADVASRRARGDTNTAIAEALGMSERSVYRLQESIRKGLPEVDSAAQAVLAEYKDSRLETTRARMLARLSDLLVIDAKMKLGILRRRRRRRSSFFA